MSRLLLLSALLAAGCTKSAPKDNGSGDPPKNDVVKVPTGDVPPPGMGKGIGGADGGKGGTDDTGKLQAAEGKLAVEAPADARAGAEATAKITVTPGAGYHVNTEFPIKLTLQAPDGVTLAKAEFKAGGMDKSKGDADVLEEQQLAIGVKLTAAKSGSYTINGTFKFAVCDKDSCLPKKETIAILVAAK
ncbi:hypothetical protein BH11MYX3_BH11MYX3_33510 [soil metagenome]